MSEKSPYSLAPDLSVKKSKLLGSRTSSGEKLPDFAYSIWMASWLPIDLRI
jgi:hypothetical protein